MHESTDNVVSEPQSARNPVANSTKRRDNVVKQKAGERREENTVVIPRGGVGDEITVNNDSYEMSKSYAVRGILAGVFGGAYTACRMRSPTISRARRSFQRIARREVQSPLYW